jgi:photosystem II stability/assembly factor-like uncharacterized protein
MIKLIAFCLAILLAFPGYSQKRKDKVPEPTSAKVRLDGFDVRKSLLENSLVKNVEFRNIGPVVMSGRVVDLEADPADPTHFYVAYASGGLWKTVNNGNTFVPVFDNQMVLTIGDIFVDWQHGETIWVGTGENNSSRSSYSGVGVYKSSDQGKTWQYMGLGESHHISRILVHPDHPEIIWVAALGHLYSPNKDRGIYKTSDGGKTWKNVLYVNENTGGVDLALDRQNPDILYASMWERERRAWNFVEGGKGSGIYKSTDGGKKWDKISSKGSGFPDGEGVGRIGLAIYKNDPAVLYAFLDNNFHKEKKKDEKKKEGLTKDELRNMSSEDFLKLEDEKIAGFLKSNRFPRKYSAKKVKEMVRSGEIKPLALVEYIEDENSVMYDTPVIGAEVYRSDDAGKTWKKTHEKPLDNVVFTYGYYFGQIRISPFNDKEIYIMGVPVMKSEDAGKTFKAIGGRNVHSDHHALWINPVREGHLINGNDGGVNISYDGGKTWSHANVPSVGQFYSVTYDLQKPYHVYGGIQDNGVWEGPNTYNPESSWYMRGRDTYKSIGGGDGMMVRVDTRDNNLVYAGSQYGNYYRYNKTTKKRIPIKPKHNLGERPLRFNWEAPIWLSAHNQDIFYYGSNKFHRSMNKGEDLETLSGDLTNGGIKGDVSYGTLTTIHESPLKFGLIYVGSDDGVVQISRDGGNTWKRISEELPQRLWVSQVWASAFEEGRVYLSLNGYRWDNFLPYIYVSEDYGETWTQLGKDLPAEPVNVIKEDPVNPDILYVGTDHGLYLSLDRGKSFMAMNHGLSGAPVHDLAVQPEAKDLIVATHGRSVYVASVKQVEKLPEIKDSVLYVFKAEKIRFSPYWGKSFGFYTPEPPMTTFDFYTAKGGNVKVEVSTKNGLVVWEDNKEFDKGLNSIEYALTVNENAKDAYAKTISKDKEKEPEYEKSDDGKYYLQKGNYKVTFTLNGTSKKAELVVE